MKRFDHTKVYDLLDDPRVKPTGIAKVADISIQTLNAIKNGKSVPNADTLAALAYAFDRPIEYFYVDACKYSDKNTERKAV